MNLLVSRRSPWLWDFMKYSDQMPKCLAGIKCRCTNWLVTVLELTNTFPYSKPGTLSVPRFIFSSITVQQYSCKAKSTWKVLFEEHGLLTMVGFGDELSTFVPPWLPSLEFPFDHQSQLLRNKRFVHYGLGTFLWKEAVHVGISFQEELKLWIAIPPEESC